MISFKKCSSEKYVKAVHIPVLQGFAVVHMSGLRTLSLRPKNGVPSNTSHLCTFIFAHNFYCLRSAHALLKHLKS